MDHIVEKRGMFMCQIACLFFLQRLIGSMKSTLTISEAPRRELFNAFCHESEDAKGKSRHSDRLIKGIWNIVCHSQKLSGPA